nr:MAG TPA: condensin subunit [Bacteriophage sp.]
MLLNHITNKTKNRPLHQQEPAYIPEDMHYNSHLYCTIFGAALQDICGAVFFIPIFRKIN